MKTSNHEFDNWNEHLLDTKEVIYYTTASGQLPIIRYIYITNITFFLEGGGCSYVTYRR